MTPNSWSPHRCCLLSLAFLCRLFRMAVPLEGNLCTAILELYAKAVTHANAYGVAGRVRLD